MAAQERNLRWRLGLFVLVILLLGGALIILFGSAPTLFKRTTPYTIVFDDAPNVVVGTPVRRSGVRIGEVRDIILDNTDDKVHVVIGIDPGKVIRKSDKPTLVGSGILGGDANIDIIPLKKTDTVTPDLTPEPPNSTLLGYRQPTVNTVLGAAEDLTPKALKTLEDISKALAELKKMQPLIEDTLTAYRDLGRHADPLVKELRDTNKQAQDAIKEIDAIAKEIRPIVPEIRKTNDELQKTLPVARDTLQQVGDLAKEVRPIVPEFRETNKQAQVALKEIGETAKSANVIAKRLDEWTQNGGRITQLIDRVSDATGRVNDVLSDENRRAIARTLKNADQASIHFPDIARNLNHITEDLANTTGPLKARGPAIIKNLDESLGKLNGTLDDVGQVVRAVGNSQGTVMKLLMDPSVYNQLEAILCGINKQMPKVDRIFNDAETFIDKVARHPEILLGIVNKGDGTKKNQDLQPLPNNLPPSNLPLLHR